MRFFQQKDIQLIMQTDRFALDERAAQSPQGVENADAIIRLVDSAVEWIVAEFLMVCKSHLRTKRFMALEFKITSPYCVQRLGQRFGFIIEYIKELLELTVG